MLRSTPARSFVLLTIFFAAACGPADNPPTDVAPTPDASASDSVKDGTETDVDCGGSGAPLCADGKSCVAPTDCESRSCASGVCQPATNTDGIKNGTETGIDCGGGAPTNSPRCKTGASCLVTADCDGVACVGGVCQPATNADEIKNGTETDIDCGGGAPTNAPRCVTGKGCLSTADCDAVLCVDAVCQSPTNADEIKNGTETDIDCGGGAPTNAPRCVTGKACKDTSDCNNVACVGTVCQPPTSADAIKNGTETDLDCGGGAPTNAPRCVTGKSCMDTTDCSNVACVGTVCQPPTSGDGIKNGTETDVDCGGGAPTNAPRCSVDKTCLAHGDCASSACALSGPKAGRCVPFKSCVKNNGGFTCGRDDRDFGGDTVSLESCCETASIPGSNVKINRFAITAGRMRAFIERLNGNVRGWVQAPATKPAGWNAAWDVLVPSSVAEAEIMLGEYWNNAPNDPNTTTESPQSKRSCSNANYNGHTYWVSSEDNQVYTQAQLDPKVLNCVGWHLVNAFCAWDGGRLANQAELRSAFTNGNTTSWPWGYPGSLYTSPYNSANQDERLNHQYNYGFPGGAPVDNRITWWLSPPGRFWQGWNANKVEIAGNVLEWTGDQAYNFAWNMSFEQHSGTMNNGGDWRTPNDRSDVPNGYYALGARCAYP